MFDSPKRYRVRHFSKHSSTPGSTPGPLVKSILRPAGNELGAPPATLPTGRARRAATLAAVIGVTLGAAVVVTRTRHRGATVHPAGPADAGTPSQPVPQPLRRMTARSNTVRWQLISRPPPAVVRTRSPCAPRPGR